MKLIAGHTTPCTAEVLQVELGRSVSPKEADTY
jgi:hypothetical protein